MTDTTIDLAGLPPPVIESVRQLVDALRQANPPVTPPRPLLGRYAHLGLSFPPEVIAEAQRVLGGVPAGRRRLMSRVVADTQSVIWSLFDPPRLSRPAVAALTAAQHDRIFISAITLVEVSYLSGKRSFPYGNVLPDILALVADPAEPLKVLPVTIEVAVAVHQVPRAEVPDMPDRIIAATALAHGLPLVSSDADIRGSAFLAARVPVVW